MIECDRGVAFIFEGATERVFYYAMLEYFCTKHEGVCMREEIDEITGDRQWVITDGIQSTLIKAYTVGTVIAHVQAGANWVRNHCAARYKQIDWTVFLCYDTDAYKYDVSQFHEGDWKYLRKAIERNARMKTIIDLAACADIEDIMLSDIEGVCTYLGVPIQALPEGKKGKTRMKKLFREAKQTYHEGERAKPLIEVLDKDRIICRVTSIPFARIEDECFGKSS